MNKDDLSPRQRMDRIHLMLAIVALTIFLREDVATSEYARSALALPGVWALARGVAGFTSLLLDGVLAFVGSRGKR